jgi:hypothetical protein
LGSSGAGKLTGLFYSTGIPGSLTPHGGGPVQFYGIEGQEAILLWGGHTSNLSSTEQPGYKAYASLQSDGSIQCTSVLWATRYRHCAASSVTMTHANQAITYFDTRFTDAFDVICDDTVVGTSTSPLALYLTSGSLMQIGDELTVKINHLNDCLGSWGSPYGNGMTAWTDPNDYNTFFIVCWESIVDHLLTCKLYNPHHRWTDIYRFRYLGSEGIGGGRVSKIFSGSVVRLSSV